ncbi:small-conductance mechanosensitive channel [Cryobacterium sp. CAN_C3]|nr:small-conductance mechanosensitive channel [Cryobacterium sp. CAN_C3]
MENESTAGEALAIARQSRTAALRRSRAAWWYYPATGSVLGGTVVAVLLAHGVGVGVAVILMAVTLPIIEFARRRVTGTRTTEAGRGRATGYAAVFLVVALAALATGWFLVMEQGVTWVAWVTGLAVFILMVVGGWVFEHTLATSMNR